MARGIPLEDQDRLPWLLALHQVIQRWLDEGSSGIITCSSLKKIYREIILNGNVGAEDFAEDKNPSRINGAAFPPQNIKFVYLKGDKETITQRMQMRTGHFMPPSLVESQCSVLIITELVHFNSKFSIDSTIYILYSIRVGDSVITTSTEVRNVGVTFNYKCDMTPHINSV
ncbi:probable gluconokinase [Lingula anatina]|uniref:gluconokinase n=1 Tax=Lingula anatina TaxID=7574 RepID=A0A1S3K207_LINAN|nr:probable gluconokinase [Lingula anatina]XP_013416307.1 probable gluconokinase [Lingula anatina]|eukprot:XP_013416306.1 probable gluconokinase [Lingula anatina]